MEAGLQIDVSGAASGWTELLPGAESIVCRAAHAAWAAVGDECAAELSVVLADDATLRRLNFSYRGKDQPTNVLSFPIGGGDPAVQAILLGDVVLALETVDREAGEQSRTIADHVSHLIVHGVLHLLGHDHESGKQATAMEGLESEILAGLGIADPYTKERQPGASPSAKMF